MQLLLVLLQNAACFLIGLLYQPDDLFIDTGCCLIAAGKRGIAAQIFIIHGFQCCHPEGFTHSQTRNHASGNLGCLLDIIAGSTGDGMEHQILCSTSAAAGHDFGECLLLGNQVAFLLRNLQGIAKCTACSRYDRDFRYRHTVFRFGRNQCVADFMIGYNQLFLG